MVGLHIPILGAVLGGSLGVLCQEIMPNQNNIVIDSGHPVHVTVNTPNGRIEFELGSILNVPFRDIEAQTYVKVERRWEIDGPVNVVNEDLSKNRHINRDISGDSITGDWESLVLNKCHQIGDLDLCINSSSISKMLENIEYNENCSIDSESRCLDEHLWVTCIQGKWRVEDYCSGSTICGKQGSGKVRCYN